MTGINYQELLENVSFDLETFKERKRLNEEHKSKFSNIDIDLDESTYNGILELAKKEGVEPEDYISDILYQTILNTFEKPSGINKTIDSAFLLTHMEDIFDSNENYLLVDSVDSTKKTVLVTEKKMIELISNQEK